MQMRQCKHRCFLGLGEYGEWGVLGQNISLAVIKSISSWDLIHSIINILNSTVLFSQNVLRADLIPYIHKYT
jgi:hypothetical protein